MLTNTQQKSIVISSTYDDLDEDMGDLVYYSGSDSHNNTNSLHAADSKPGTRALKRSYLTQNPVRLLRAADSKSMWAPPCGIRYDGLYRVEAELLPTNPKGGKYEQFKLRRIPNQRPIKEYYLESPSTQQKRDFQKIQDGY
jgi:hypothetical protein